MAQQHPETRDPIPLVHALTSEIIKLHMLQRLLRTLDTLADHFYGPGAIPWQWNMLV